VNSQRPITPASSRATAKVMSAGLSIGTMRICRTRTAAGSSLTVRDTRQRTDRRCLILTGHAPVARLKSPTKPVAGQQCAQERHRGAMRIRHSGAASSFGLSAERCDRHSRDLFHWQGKFSLSCRVHDRLQNVCRTRGESRGITRKPTALAYGSRHRSDRPARITSP
jgi:hypothetical protein